MIALNSCIVAIEEIFTFECEANIPTSICPVEYSDEAIDTDIYRFNVNVRAQGWNIQVCDSFSTIHVASKVGQP
jgi:hypothetical protein